MNTAGTRLEERTAAGPQPAAVDVDVAALFAAHAGFLVRTAHRLCGSRAVAEDVVQEVFLIAHRKRDSLVAGEDIRGWLYRVMIHRISHWRRGAMRRQLREDTAAPPDETPATPEDAVAQSARARMVREAVAGIPLVQREVFVLFELEGQSGAEVAALLGIPVNTVWTRLAAGRQKFRKAFELAQRRVSR